MKYFFGFLIILLAACGATDFNKKIIGKWHLQTANYPGQLNNIDTNVFEFLPNGKMLYANNNGRSVNGRKFNYSINDAKFTMIAQVESSEEPDEKTGAGEIITTAILKSSGDTIFINSRNTICRFPQLSQQRLAHMQRLYNGDNTIWYLLPVNVR